MCHLQTLLLALLPLLHSIALGATETVAFDFALYFAPEPLINPADKLAALQKDTFPEFETIGSATGGWVPIADYAPPDRDSFRYTSHGLDASIALELERATRVFVLHFESPVEKSIQMNKVACELTADLAEATGGYPWDDECRLIYSREAWRAKRVDSWQGDLPDIRCHMNMHAYRNPDLVRIITLGMRKFGRPDLAMEDVFSGTSRSAGNTINFIAQHLVENPRRLPRSFTLKLDMIKHDEVRKSALENPLEGSTGKVSVALVEAEWEEGDPYNTLAKVTFPEIGAPTEPERQSIAFSQLYGSKDEIQNIRSGDPEIAATSARARIAFTALKPSFEDGIEPNERYVVKHGFQVPGRKEFMWVEVLAWGEDTIEGILLNDSYYDDNLKEGKRVKIPVDEIFDYIHYLPDGTFVGNETGKIIESRQ